MKFTPLIFAATLLTSLPMQTTSWAAAPAATAPATADAAWAEFEPLLQDPKGPTASKEAIEALFKPYIQTLDAKAAAFLKAYPADPRRGTLVVRVAEIRGMREFVGLTDPADLPKWLEEVVAAPGVDAKIKAQASAARVEILGTNDELFEPLATAHVKAFPDAKENRKFTTELKRITREKELKKAPLEFKFTALDGREVDLEKLRGKVVLIDFWATWCGPCVEEIPHILETYHKLHDKGFEIIGISFDESADKEKVRKFVKDKKMPWPQYVEKTPGQNAYAQKYAVTAIPCLWLVNKKGMLAETDARENLAAKVEKLLAE